MNTQPTFENIQELLRSLKGLSKDESKILIKIIERGKVTATEVGEILSELNLTKTVSRPYVLLSSLEAKGVVFEDSSNNKTKTYIAIHPRDLLFDLRENFKSIDLEVGKLEQLKEVPEFEIDPRKDTKLLKQEIDIINSLLDFREQKHEIDVIINSKIIKESDSFKKRLSQHKINYSEGEINIALISNKSRNCYVTIFISRIEDVKDRRKIIFYGSQIVDKKVYDFMKSKIREDK